MRLTPYVSFVASLLAALLSADASYTRAGAKDPALTARKRRCEAWCSEYTCSGTNPQSNQPFAEDCGECAACKPKPKIGAAKAGTECLGWCNPWTCDQPDFCGGCSHCAPKPPPPPRRPQRHRTNPFVTPNGWYLNPSLRQNLEDTLADATPQERRRTLLGSSAVVFDCGELGEVDSCGLNTCAIRSKRRSAP
jgi:hypothetical protein